MNTVQVLGAFPKIAALVVGDIRLDRRCTYDPEAAEPSRESGIPRLAIVAAEVTPGAGGTVASNLVALEAYRVAALGLVGDDGYGVELLRELKARSISTELVVKSAAVPTFACTRLINGRTGLEDQPRLDRVSIEPVPEQVERKILTRLESAVGGYDVVIVADHIEPEHGGVITPAMRNVLRELAAHHRDKVFWVDSRKHSEHFRKVTLRLNRQEADETSLRMFGAIDYQRLRQHLESRALMVTRGERGVLVVEPGRETPVETVPVPKPVDVYGAGDSFSAGAALALSVTGSAVEAARFGNLVASITIMKKGAGIAMPQEVLAADEALG